MKTELENWVQSDSLNRIFTHELFSQFNSICSTVRLWLWTFCRGCQLLSITATSALIFRVPCWHSLFSRSQQTIKTQLSSFVRSIWRLSRVKNVRKKVFFRKTFRRFSASYSLSLLFAVWQRWIINSHIENNSIKVSQRFEVAIMLVFYVWDFVVVSSTKSSVVVASSNCKFSTISISQRG